MPGEVGRPRHFQELLEVRAWPPSWPAWPSRPRGRVLGLRTAVEPGAVRHSLYFIPLQYRGLAYVALGGLAGAARAGGLLRPGA